MNSMISDQLMLGGFSLTRTSTPALVHQLSNILHSGAQRPVFFANTNFIVKCQPLRDELRQNHAIIINDGIGVDIATWLVHRDKFYENLNGTDFIPSFLHRINADARVFLFGGKPGVAEKAASTLRDLHKVNVVGVRNGYDEAKNVEDVIDHINNSQANIVLVAMGNPMQEQWIVDHYRKTHANLFFGVGACLDFLAGDKPRAPDWIRRCRLEWLYRLSLEPARLVRRYTIDIAVFLALCIRMGKSDHSALAED